MSIRVPVLRRISMNFQARFPSQPIQLFWHQVGLFETRPPWNPRSIWSYDPYVVYVSWWFTITFPIQLASLGFKALIFRPRQLHLQMEGLDRPKVGEWRDTKGFYGASIPLAWAQAWTTRRIRNRWLAMMIFSDTNRKPHKIKHKIKQPEKWMMILEYLGASWGVRYPKSSFKPSVWKNNWFWIIPNWEWGSTSWCHPDVQDAFWMQRSNQSR